MMSNAKQSEVSLSFTSPPGFSRLMPAPHSIFPETSLPMNDTDGFKVGFELSHSLRNAQEADGILSDSSESETRAMRCSPTTTHKRAGLGHRQQLPVHARPQRMHSLHITPTTARLTLSASRMT